MLRIIRNEEKITRRHSSLWPIIFIVAGAILLAAAVGYIIIAASKSIQPQDRYNPLQNNSTSQ